MTDTEDDGRRRYRGYWVTSGDGTRLRAWTNDVDGILAGTPDLPAVLLCNGLGTGPWTWPALLEPGCGVRVVSWNHRGVGGSERPVEKSRIGIDAFVEDALAVLDDAGLAACPVVGWSMGVNTAFELATRHPERVTGLFAVGGVPGGTFSSMLGPMFVPRPLRSPVTVGGARLMKLAGRPLTALARSLPTGQRSIGLLSHSGFMMPTADPEVTGRAMRDFLSTPVGWFMDLALASSRHLRVSLRGIRVPTAFVAGRYDLLASTHDMRTAAERIPGATYTELRGTHFLTLERPAHVHALMLDWLERVRDA